MKRVITTERLASCDLLSFQAALTKIGGAARIANNNRQPWGGSSTIHIEDDLGWNISGVSLTEETLSDGSRVYNAQLHFGELGAATLKQVEALERKLRAARTKRRTALANVQPTAQKETPCQS